MRFLGYALLSMSFLFAACGDDDTSKSNLGPGSVCTSDDQCASNDCTAGICVGGGADAGPGGTYDAGTIPTADAGTGGAG